MKIEVALKIENETTTLELRTTNAHDKNLLKLATQGKKIHSDFKETEEGCFIIKFMEGKPQ